MSLILTRFLFCPAFNIHVQLCMKTCKLKDLGQNTELGEDKRSRKRRNINFEQLDDTIANNNNNKSGGIENGNIRKRRFNSMCKLVVKPHI